jgi:hypothetical protein
MHVTPHVTETIIKPLKLLLSLKARANQVIGVEIIIQGQDSNSKIQVLFSVDRLTQSGNFENLLESNHTLLPKENLFLMTCSTSVQF